MKHPARRLEDGTGVISARTENVRMFSGLGANSYTTLGEFPVISRGKIMAYSLVRLLKPSFRLEVAIWSHHA